MTIQEYNDLFKYPLKKSVKLTVVSSGMEITNENIVSESMTIESSLCSEENLRYGCCESSCFSIRLAGIDTDLIGKWLLVQMDIVTDVEGYILLQDGSYLLTQDGDKVKMSYEESERITLGYFKVYSDKPVADKPYRDLVCYDIMYDVLNTDVSAWYEQYILNATTTVNLNGVWYFLVMWLHDNSVAKYGKEFNAINIDEITFINGLLVIEPSFSVDGELACKDVLNAFCEMNGLFGWINPSTDRFEFVNLSDVGLVTIDHYVNGTCSYEDYTTSQITGVVARGEEEDVGTSVGTMTNPYIIEANPFVYGIEGTQALEDALTNLLNLIKTQTFIPFNMTTYGNPMLPLGTQMTINTRDKTIVSYVINKSMSGIQALKDKISATGEEYQPTQVNSLTSRIQRTGSKVHKLIIDVNQLDSEINDTTTGIKSQILQMSNEILLKVDSNGNLALVSLTGDPDTGQTAFVVKAGNFEVDASGNVTIKGNLTSLNALKFNGGGEDEVDFTLLDTYADSGQFADDFIIQLYAYDGTPVIKIYDDDYIQHHLNHWWNLEFAPFYATNGGVHNTFSLDANGKIESSSEISLTQAPSTQKAQATITQYDNNYGLIGFMGPMQKTDGTIYNRFAVCREISSNIVYNRIELGVSPTGTYDVVVDAPTEWRTAIGAAPASSREYKTNIAPISDSEARKILDVNIYTFDYKEAYGGDTGQIGVLAEEVRELIPFAVNDNGEKMSVDYWKFVPHLIKMVQLQEEKIKSLEERIAKLEEVIQSFALDTIVNNSKNEGNLA